MREKLSLVIKKTYGLIRSIILTIFITGFFIVFLSCSSGFQEENKTIEIPDIKEGIVNPITAEEVYGILTAGIAGYFIVDVRTPEEFGEGHIKGATLIPVSEIETRLSEIPAEQAVVVYCKSGSRSLKAANLLVENGYPEVLDMDGGIEVWKAMGYPLAMD